INATATGGSWANGLNNLISFGSQSFALGDFSLTLGTALTPRQINNGLVLNGNNIALSISGDSPKWTGALNGTWSTATLSAPKNWKLVTAGTTTDYINGDDVLFDDSATGTTAVNISAANVSPTTTTFNNSTKTYTISSSGSFGIAGSGGITK